MSGLVITRLALGPATWQLWQVNLDAPPSAAQLAALAPAERERAARFVFERDRQRYLAGRAALRALLAPCSGLAASRLVLREAAHGKPFLDGVDPARGWAFNLTHSGATALIALAPPTGVPRHIGIDLEALRPLPDAAALAAAHFTPAELAALPAPESAGYLSAFFMGWTRKEACLKALGWGLAIAPSAVDAGVTPELRQVRVQPAEPSPSQPMQTPSLQTLHVETALAPPLGVISWAEWLAHTAPQSSTHAAQPAPLVL